MQKAQFFGAKLVLLGVKTKYLHKSSIFYQYVYKKFIFSLFVIYILAI